MAETAALGVLQFQQKIKGAVRPNLFQVNHDFPSAGGLNVNKELATFLCKSAALPASTVGTVELPCLLYTSPSPRDKRQSRMPSSA